MRWRIPILSRENLPHHFAGYINDAEAGAVLVSEMSPVSPVGLATYETLMVAESASSSAPCNAQAARFE
jgi:hypothetical protein